MRSKASIRKLMIGVVFALVTTGAVPVLAASVGGPNVTAKAKVDALNSPDQTVYLDVAINRNMGPLGDHPHVTVDHYNHREQAENEDPEDYSHGWDIVTVGRIGPEGVEHYSVDDGRPCNTCGPIDRICALLGDRC